MREVYTGMNPNEIESECLNGIYNEIANVIGIDAARAIDKGMPIEQLKSRGLLYYFCMIYRYNKAFFWNCIYLLSLLLSNVNTPCPSSYVSNINRFK